MIFKLRPSWKSRREEKARGAKKKREARRKGARREEKARGAKIRLSLFGVMDFPGSALFIFFLINYRDKNYDYLSYVLSWAQKVELPWIDHNVFRYSVQNGS